jgi:hypothetical protein
MNVLGLFVQDKAGSHSNTFVLDFESRAGISQYHKAQAKRACHGANEVASSHHTYRVQRYWWAAVG